MKWLLETIGDAIPMSDYTTIVARVVQMMTILLYLNHVIAPRGAQKELDVMASAEVSGQNHTKTFVFLMFSMSLLCS